MYVLFVSQTAGTHKWIFLILLSYLASTTIIDTIICVFLHNFNTITCVCVCVASGFHTDYNASKSSAISSATKTDSESERKIGIIRGWRRLPQSIKRRWKKIHFIFTCNAKREKQIDEDHHLCCWSQAACQFFFSFFFYLPSA